MGQSPEAEWSEGRRAASRSRDSGAKDVYRRRGATVPWWAMIGVQSALADAVNNGDYSDYGADVIARGPLRTVRLRSPDNFLQGDAIRLRLINAAGIYKYLNQAR